MKVLIVEDEIALVDSIESYLTKEGYICDRALDYTSASEKIALYQYDCILVDISLPDGNGLDIIREIMKQSLDSGIIIISAKGSLDDKVDGLQIGADDYLTKPFHLSELNARIKSIIRRRKFKGRNEIVFNEIIILPESAAVTVDKNSLELTKKEYDLLIYFISNKNRVLTKSAIAEHLWGDNIDMADSFDFIYTHIKNLRRKILDKGGNDYIKTIYGLGYMLKDVEE
jgi:DNA-binding response OmpR family regulator